MKLVLWNVKGFIDPCKKAMVRRVRNNVANIAKGSKMNLLEISGKILVSINVDLKSSKYWQHENSEQSGEIRDICNTGLDLFPKPRYILFA